MDVGTVMSQVTRCRHGTSLSHSLGEASVHDTQDEMTAPASVNQPRPHTGYWSPASMLKEMTKVKTNSDIIVIYEETNDKFDESHRWVLYVLSLQKSPFPDVDRDRSEVWKMSFSKNEPSKENSE